MHIEEKRECSSTQENWHQLVWDNVHETAKEYSEYHTDFNSEFSEKKFFHKAIMKEIKKLTGVKVYSLEEYNKEVKEKYEKILRGIPLDLTITKK